MIVADVFLFRNIDCALIIKTNLSVERFQC